MPRHGDLAPQADFRDQASHSSVIPSSEVRLLVEIAEVGVDSCGSDVVVFGVVGAEAGEDVQGLCPVLAGPFPLVQCVVGAGETVVGAGLIGGLTETRCEVERPLVACERLIRAAGGVVQAAHALQCLELHVAIADLPGKAEDMLVVVGGLVMLALSQVSPSQVDHRGEFTVPAPDDAGDVQGLLDTAGGLLVPTQPGAGSCSRCASSTLAAIGRR
jgi:hypothetical protein